MSRFFFLVLFQIFIAEFISAQVADSTSFLQIDSLAQKDTNVRNDPLQSFPLTDSISKRPIQQQNREVSFGIQNIRWQILQHHPYFSFTSRPITIRSDIKQFQGKEVQFYVLISLLILYGTLRKVFPKYFHDLFRLFFRNTIKQLQVREQLIQTPLPSLILNIFFIVVAGMYVSFLLPHVRIKAVDNFWLMSFYCMIGLSVIYFIKFLGLKLSGWLFNIKEATDSYIFIVFVINKMIGLLLLPFLVLLAFTGGNLYSISLTLSCIVLVGLFGYRFILAYATIRNQVRVNLFHFFLYLCAFEIAPLLLIYRALLLFFHLSA